MVLLESKSLRVQKGAAVQKSIAATKGFPNDVARVHITAGLKGVAVQKSVAVTCVCRCVLGSKSLRKQKVVAVTKGFPNDVAVGFPNKQGFEKHCHVHIRICIRVHMHINTRVRGVWGFRV